MKFHNMVLLISAISLVGCTLGDEYAANSERRHEAKYVTTESSAYMRTTFAGNVLTTPDGMTVYTYDKEAKGQPSCLGECAEQWFAVLAPEGAQPVGELTIVEAIDGTHQWAYQGKPLYLYNEDKAPGDVEGDNKDDGSWHVVKLKRS
jgi:predicted lipoprotein with Yx(FWY)xxD motif